MTQLEFSFIHADSAKVYQVANCSAAKRMGKKQWAKRVENNNLTLTTARSSTGYCLQATRSPLFHSLVLGIHSAWAQGILFSSIDVGRLSAFTAKPVFLFSSLLSKVSIEGY